jgi:hypothetical protein
VATDLAAHQADPAEISAWARGHWIIENTVHWTKDVTFAEDASQVRRHGTPAVMTTLRDLARAALHRAGRANIASGRRAHTLPPNSSHPPWHPMIKTDEGHSPRGPVLCPESRCPRAPGETPCDLRCTKVPTISLIPYLEVLNLIGISAGHEGCPVPTSDPGHTGDRARVGRAGPGLPQHLGAEGATPLS